MADHYAFEPRSAFKRVDRNKNYSLSNWELQDFLRDNGFYALGEECKLVIAAYDGDKDDKLDFKEFERLILTNNNDLKMRAYGRPEPYLGPRDRLHIDVEYEVAKLMKMEIDNLKDLN